MWALRMFQCWKKKKGRVWQCQVTCPSGGSVLGLLFRWSANHVSREFRKTAALLPTNDCLPPWSASPLPHWPPLRPCSWGPRPLQHEKPAGSLRPRRTPIGPGCRTPRWPSSPCLHLLSPGPPWWTPCFCTKSRSPCDRWQASPNWGAASANA